MDSGRLDSGVIVNEGLLDARSHSGPTFLLCMPLQGWSNSRIETPVSGLAGSTAQFWRVDPYTAQYMAATLRKSRNFEFAHAFVVGLSALLSSGDFFLGPCSAGCRFHPQDSSTDIAPLY